METYEATSREGLAALHRARRAYPLPYQIGIADPLDDHAQAILFALELAQLERLVAQFRDHGVLYLSPDGFDDLVQALVTADEQAGHDCHARCVLVNIAGSLGIVFT
jgi:hypothetical protein